MDTLLNIFKALLLIAGSLVLLEIIISIIVMPIRNKIIKKKRVAKLYEIANQILEDLKKEQEKEENKPKKTVKKPRNTKKNEEK